jgi:uroporphyrinogen decarboxylase
MNDTFLKACRGEKTDYTPIWMMRQAGRFLPQYRKVSDKHGFLAMCRTPELAAEVTIQPVDVLGVDAAIFFSDILTTVVPMGMDLRYDEGKGPSFTNPIKSGADVDRLIVPDPEETLGFVYRAQKILARELAKKVPLIGFAGGPFTVAAYMIEGGGTHSFNKVKTFAFTQTEAFMTLMDKVSRLTASYLQMQAKAGSNALMIFDSFAGVLGPKDYLELNFPYVKRIIADIKKTGVPIIYFGLGQHGGHAAIGKCGADVIGVDYNVNLDAAITHLGANVSVQGNLEPYVLLQSREQIVTRAKDVLARARKARGHIFNLGHGVPLGTPVDNAKALVDAVHELSRK